MMLLYYPIHDMVIKRKYLSFLNIFMCICIIRRTKGMTKAVALLMEGRKNIRKFNVQEIRGRILCRCTRVLQQPKKKTEFALRIKKIKGPFFSRLVGCCNTTTSLNGVSSRGAACVLVSPLSLYTYNNCRKE